MIVVMQAAQDELVVPRVESGGTVLAPVLGVQFEGRLQVVSRPGAGRISRQPAVSLVSYVRARGIAEVVGAAWVIRIVQMVCRSIHPVQALEPCERGVEHDPSASPKRERNRNPIDTTA